MVGDVRYGLVVYDTKGHTRMRLATNEPKEFLEQLLGLIPWRREGTKMDKGVEKGLELLGKPSSPGAKKVIVVFTNGKIASSDQALAKIRRLIENQGVKVIAVGLGSRVDLRQLNHLLPDYENIVLVDVTGDEHDVIRKVKDAAHKIGEASKRGKIHTCNIRTHICNLLCRSK